jgi:IK cytokine
MTPRHPGDGGPSSRSGGDMGPPSAGGISSSIKKHVDKEKFDKRKKKKQFYSKIKKEEDDAMAELAKKYRDRAKERRDGGLPDQQQQRESELLTSQGAYRAVAPDFRGYFYYFKSDSDKRKMIIQNLVLFRNVDAAERRKQMIQVRFMSYIIES